MYPKYVALTKPTATGLPLPNKRYTAN